MRLRRFASSARAAGLAVTLLLSAAPSEAQTALKFTLPFGPHAVGYRSTVLYDHSRSVPKDTVDASGDVVRTPRPRPVHLSVWYPAKRTTSRVMRYREYLDMYGPALRLAGAGKAGHAAAEDALTRWSSLLIRNPGVSLEARREALKAAIRREGDIATHAVLNAPSDGAAYPIVIYAAGAEGPSFENDVLMEYLASLGYLAIGVPCWNEAGGAFHVDAGTLEAQSRDIELALGYARRLAGEAAEPVGVVGWSWGGLSNVVVAARNQSVNAIVGLDPSVRYYWHDASLREKVENARTYSTPSLFLNQAGTPLKFIAQIGGDTTFTFFDSLRYADAYRVTMPNMRHQNFSSLYNRLAGPQPNFFVADAAVASAGYTTLAAYVATFMDAYLKKSATARQLLVSGPQALGVTDTSVTMTFKRAHRPVPAMSAFRAALGPRGWASAPDVMARLRASDAEYTLHPDSLDNAGWDLIKSGRAADAVAVYRLYTQLHPGLVDSWNGLGDAYVAVHDTANAVVSYREALKIAPADASASAALKGLVKSP